MTQANVRWASHHDWYIKAGLTISGKPTVIVRDDLNANKQKIFHNFKELTEWAGY